MVSTTYPFRIRDIQHLADKDIPSILLLEFLAGRLQPLFVIVVDDHTGPFVRKSFGNGFADTTRTTRDKRNTSRQRLRLWHPLQLSLFQQPVFDIESLLSRQ